MPRMFRIGFFTSVFAISIFTASIAVAAPAVWEKVNVTLHSEPAGGVLLVSGDLPSDASLPAQVELPVPTAGRLQWIGEILGGDSSSDLAVEYTKSLAGVSDVYRFTLAKARTAQVEILTGEAQSFDGSVYSPSLRWTSSQAVPEVRMSVRIPQGSRIVTPSAGASLEAGESGYLYYTKVARTVKSGDQMELSFAYSAPAGLQATTAATPVGAVVAAGPDPAVLVVVLGAVLILTAVALVAVRSRQRSKNSREEAAMGAASGRAGRATEASRAEPGDAKETGPRIPCDDALDVEETRRHMSGRAKRTAITVAMIAVMIIIAGVVGKETTKPQLSGDTISQTFAAGDPCATADIALTVEVAADPAKTAEALFAALRPVTGMNTATYDRKASTVRAGFCESKTSEAAVRAALQPTGLLATAEAGSSPLVQPAP